MLIPHPPSEAQLRKKFIPVHVAKLPSCPADSVNRKGHLLIRCQAANSSDQNVFSYSSDAERH